jgi:general L-amino acid transport system substrate-binding protein
VHHHATTGAGFDPVRIAAGPVLARNSTWTIGREAELELTFIGVTYYDGQGFMLPRARNVLSALELADAKVCVQGGTTTEANLGDFIRANNLAYEAANREQRTAAKQWVKLLRVALAKQARRF